MFRIMLAMPMMKTNKWRTKMTMMMLSSMMSMSISLACVFDH